MYLCNDIFIIYMYMISLVFGNVFNLVVVIVYYIDLNYGVFNYFYYNILDFNKLEILIY